MAEITVNEVKSELTDDQIKITIGKKIFTLTINEKTETFSVSTPKQIIILPAYGNVVHINY